VAVVALVVGLGIGVGVAGGDPTQTEEYEALQSQIAGEKQRADNWKVTAEGAQASAPSAASSASAAASSAAQRRAELDQREAAVVARERAVTATEQQVAANSIEEGSWTVGRDIAPGTYRASQSVGSGCYWKITRSGTNGDDILQNDIPGGGIPTVTLREGQDFTNHGCGTSVKQ